MDANGIRVGRDLHVADGVLSRPVLLDRVLEEGGQRVKIVPNRHVSYFVLGTPPNLVRLDLTFADRAHRAHAKELFGAGEARRDPSLAAWVRPVFHPGPYKKLRSEERRVGKECRS